MANGKIKRTYSLMGTGISYVDTSGKAKNNKRKPIDKNTKASDEKHQLIFGETTTYDNSKTDALRERDSFFKEIERLRKINFIANILLIMIIFASVPILIICPIIGITIKTLLSTKLSITLNYNFDEYKKKEYGYLVKGLSHIASSKKIWQINTSTKVLNVKYNAGASNNLVRHRVVIKNKLPFYIKHQIDVISFNLKGKRMFFMPDRVMFFEGLYKVYGREYDDMHINLKSTRFIEESSVPKDAIIVDTTWKYVNKNGDPDRRFNSNKKLPVCNYGVLGINTDDGINILLHFSNVSDANEINKDFDMFGRYHNDSLNENISSDNKISKNPGSPDELYDRVKKFISGKDEVTKSDIQSEFNIGYNKASAIMSRLKDEGFLTNTNLVRK